MLMDISGIRFLYEFIGVFVESVCWVENKVISTERLHSKAWLPLNGLLRFLFEVKGQGGGRTKRAVLGA